MLPTNDTLNLPPSLYERYRRYKLLFLADAYVLVGLSEPNIGTVEDVRHAPWRLCPDDLRFATYEEITQVAHGLNLFINEDCVDEDEEPIDEDILTSGLDLRTYDLYTKKEYFFSSPPSDSMSLPFVCLVKLPRESRT